MSAVRTTCDYDEDDYPINPGVSWQIGTGEVHIGWRDGHLQTRLAGTDTDTSITVEQVRAFARELAALLADDEPDPNVAELAERLADQRQQSVDAEAAHLRESLAYLHGRSLHTRAAAHGLRLPEQLREHAHQLQQALETYHHTLNTLLPHRGTAAPPITPGDETVVVTYSGGPLHAHQIRMARWQLDQLYQQQHHGLILTEYPDGAPIPPTRYVLRTDPAGTVWHLVEATSTDPML